MNINVCLIQPPEYIHSLALLEAAEYVTYKANLSGYSTNLSLNYISADALNIVFGAHIIPKEIHAFPPNTIIFNTEQLSVDSMWTNSEYFKIINSHIVWDYSQANLKHISHKNKFLINYLYINELKRIEPEKIKAYDLLFYGSINERRRNILLSLQERGLRIKSIFGVYGPQRDALLKNTKAVLNLHYYESQIFQQIRAFYPLINEIPVISENYPASSAHKIYEDAIFTPGSTNLIDYIVSLFKTEDELIRLFKPKLNSFASTLNNLEFATALHDSLCALKIKA